MEAAESIVGDVGSFTVRGSLNFMWIIAHWDASNHMEIGGVDDGQGVVLLGED
jgi:hypothetical protein